MELDQAARERIAEYARDYAGELIGKMGGEKSADRIVGAIIRDSFGGKTSLLNMLQARGYPAEAFSHVLPIIRDALRTEPGWH